MRITKRDVWQFIRFALCNQAAWLGDLAMFSLLYEAAGVHYTLSKFGSYTVGALISYTMNRKVTFRAETQFISKTLLKFIAVNCLSVSASLGSMAIFNSILGWGVWIGYFVSILFSFSINFLGSRFWVFRDCRKS